MQSFAETGIRGACTVGDSLDAAHRSLMKYLSGLIEYRKTGSPPPSPEEGYAVPFEWSDMKDIPLSMCRELHDALNECFHRNGEVPQQKSETSENVTKTEKAIA